MVYPCLCTVCRTKHHADHPLKHRRHPLKSRFSPLLSSPSLNPISLLIFPLSTFPLDPFAIPDPPLPARPPYFEATRMAPCETAQKSNYPFTTSKNRKANLLPLKTFRETSAHSQIEIVVKGFRGHRSNWMRYWDGDGDRDRVLLQFLKFW